LNYAYKLKKCVLKNKNPNRETKPKTVCDRVSTCITFAASYDNDNSDFIYDIRTSTKHNYRKLFI